MGRGEVLSEGLPDVVGLSWKPQGKIGQVELLELVDVWASPHKGKVWL